MDETSKYLYALLKQKGFENVDAFRQLFDAFAARPDNTEYVTTIRQLQELMATNWQVFSRREEIKTMHLPLPNGNAGKPYDITFSLNEYGLSDVTSFTLTGFEGSGLEYNAETGKIYGTPQAGGDIPLTFFFNFEGEPEDAEPNLKKITLIINHDPKLLWKNIPSDINDAHYKPDAVAECVSFLGGTLLAASVRGRSHANKGTFRDDHYGYAELANDWGIIAVADGAGSAKLSRKGSEIACTSVIEYFKVLFRDKLVNLYEKEQINTILKQAVAKALLSLGSFADETGNTMADLYTTLSFTLINKTEEGFNYYSFGIGDSPIVVVSRDFETIISLNKIDSGEFGGGTRFLTQDVLADAEFEKRLQHGFVKGFPYLVLMTDGIYDPKFEVEANLLKADKWQQFFNNLGGNNEEEINVLQSETPDSALLKWMEFWSPGNHDDRTLVLLF